MLDGLELLQALSHGVDSYITRMEQKDTPLNKERIEKLYANIASRFRKTFEPLCMDTTVFLVLQCTVTVLGFPVGGTNPLHGRFSVETYAKTKGASPGSANDVPLTLVFPSI